MSKIKKLIKYRKYINTVIIWEEHYFLFVYKISTFISGNSYIKFNERRTKNSAISDLLFIIISLIIK